jgi:hypothetical protein
MEFRIWMIRISIFAPPNFVALRAFFPTLAFD